MICELTPPNHHIETPTTMIYVILYLHTMPTILVQYKVNMQAWSLNGDTSMYEFLNVLLQFRLAGMCQQSRTGPSRH